MGNILNRIPVNKTAALVVNNKPEEASHPHKRISSITSMIQLPFSSFSGFKREHDITGKRFGRLLVLGVYDSIGKARSKPTSWVTKCRCGRYEVFRGKTLRRGNVTSCHDCYMKSKLNHIPNIPNLQK